MKSLLIAAGLLLCASVGWKYRDSLTQAPESLKPTQPIVFDNGSSREPPSAGNPPPSNKGIQVRAEAPAGVMRKCVRQGETTYTNVRCPAGFHEKTVDGGHVTVIPAIAPPASTEVASTGARQRLRNALDLGPEGTLSEP